MAVRAESNTLKRDSASKFYHCLYCKREAIIKHRIVSDSGSDDHVLHLQLTKEQTVKEVQTILKCKTNGIAVPVLYSINMKKCKIIMENVIGLSVQKFLKTNIKNTEAVIEVLMEIGNIVQKMHSNNISHGCLNTSNMLIKNNSSIVLINFGLSNLNPSANDKVKDLCSLEQSFIDEDHQIADKFSLILIGYKEYGQTNCNEVLSKLNYLRTKSTMVYSSPKIESNRSTRLRSTIELTPTKSLRSHKIIDEMLPKDDQLYHSPKNKTSKSIKNITIGGESNSKTSKSLTDADTIPHLRELKLNIKRIDETNYVSMLSPRSLKLIDEKSPDITIKPPKASFIPTTPKSSSRKSLRWSERCENDVLNLVDELMNNSDSEEENHTSKKRFRKLSNASSYSSESDDNMDTLEPISPHRTLRSSMPSTSNKPNGTADKLESLTPKRSRKPVERFGELVDLNRVEMENTPPENKRTRRTSVSAAEPSKQNLLNVSEPVTPKRNRKSYVQLVDSNGLNETETTITPSKRTRRTSVLLTPSKSNKLVNSLEPVTPKRARKSVSHYGEPINSNEITTTPKSNKKNRSTSIEDDEDVDFDDNVWKTPVNKRLRLSMTPTSRSGSRVRRSILQDIPENKEIEVSTPKTPRKTPKAHVKNLTPASIKRSDSGARVPCSPLEKARANLHLHAAPKHLPCRETEFKSIHSFLARKINDELTGSMYISGVPGTGKTATVRRVIDSLNSDIIMKHSFKFIEINGLRLANPHQAFSVIWKELTAETVSSTRAQALLNDYFSGNKVKELSTVLLVDEVDHICNRKQDVVYNILDWPSRTGSKVVVITIANTMDLPERVLRGCVTSRMGLTRLVFKPYSFQQLQEIIMNRLIGNSTFDPDAVQLVARKVAAISGDARRALDVCRRAIDLIKSDDDSQLITINHVNQVLNSILSGVRVTAIRHCSLLEQFFLKALRDETIRTGFDHSTIDSVYIQMKNICLLEGEELPNDQQVIMMAYRLRDSGLIFLEKKRWDIFRKVSLNVSPEDISYALDKYNL